MESRLGKSFVLLPEVYVDFCRFGGAKDVAVLSWSLLTRSIMSSMIEV